MTQDPGDAGALIAKETRQEHRAAHPDTTRSSRLSATSALLCTRRVQQEVVAGRYEQALARAQDLERSLDNRRKTPAAVQQLVDVLASLVYLRTGSTQGYPGAVLKVRPPAQGSEWLCRPAEPDPALDDPVFYGTSDSGASFGAMPRLPTAGVPLLLPHSEQPPGKDQAADVTSPPSLQQRTALMLSRHRPRGYRCLTDAVKAASDGDVIEMLPGTHPSGSDSLDGGVVIDKRLLIRGAPDKTVCLDHRANHPVLRLQRGALITGLSIEMSGFREAVRCEGPCSYPTVDHCSISCSGSDAVHVTGRCCPLLANCQLQGKKCGLRVWSNKSDYDSIAGSSGGQAAPHTQPRLHLLRVPAQLQPCLPSTPSSPAPTHSIATAASQLKARGSSQPTLILPEAAAKNSVLARLLIQQHSGDSCCPAAQSPSPPPYAHLAASSGACTPPLPHTSPAPALPPSPPAALAVAAACLPGPHAQLLGCSMAGCGVSGVVAAGSAFVEMVGGCVVEGCSQEGVALSGVAVAMLRGVE
ncbi:hypothetical protein QJQ45_014539, partial [Haematococcus lacustris]